jgi:acyl-homoserine-lactone acylase
MDFKVSTSKRFAFGVGLGLIALSVGVVGLAHDTEHYRVEIRRTSYGIPHIKADDYGSLGYGLGYAFATDNHCMFANHLTTVSGERSKYFGPDGSSLQSGSSRTGFNNLRSDFFFKTLFDENALVKAYNASPPEMQQEMTGYVEGYNRFIAEGKFSQDCKDAKYLREIGVLDLLRHNFEQVSHSSSEVLLDAVYAAQAPYVGAKISSEPVLNAPSSREVRDFFKLDTDESKMGSNAVALGRDTTENGKGMLLGNPHFPASGPDRFYEMHLTIPGKLDVMGGSLAGVPVVNIGFNNRVAWSHTVSTAFRFTIFELKLVAGDPTSYWFDGEKRKMTSKTVTVQVLQPDGSLKNSSRTLWRTHFGQMIASDALRMGWGSTFAYTIRDANAENSRFIEQWWRINQAKSAAGIKRALEQNVAVPWVNTIAADAAGNAFYADIGAVPNVSDAKAKQCVQGFLGKAIYAAAKLPVLDGSASACEWDNDNSAPQAGILAGKNMPSITRSDWVMNSNDSYWLSSLQQPLTGFPRIIGDEGTPRSLRTRLGYKLILERLAGTDGLAGNKFSLATLQQLLFNNRNLGAELLTDSVVKNCPANLEKPCSILAKWDKRENLESVGAVVWREFWTRARRLPLWAVPFDIKDPVNTPRDLNTDPAVLEQIYAALSDAVTELEKQKVPLDASLGSVQYAVRGDKNIPIHGGFGDEGVYNVQFANLKNGHYEPITGSSYMQTVTWDDDYNPQAEALLSYSLSPQSDNPHFADQTELYSQKKFVKLPFLEAQIKADPNFSSIFLEH